MDGFTAIIPTSGRLTALEKTLGVLRWCNPPPVEILVHANGEEAAEVLKLCSNLEFVRTIYTPNCVGPGGARNKLLLEARTEWVASFDDDSYPIDKDFFSLAMDTVSSLSTNDAVVACAIFEKDAPAAPTVPPPASLQRCLDFANGGCLWRRKAFLKTTGFVPLRDAWCMEEQDVGLQLYTKGRNVMFAPHLRVFHDSERLHHTERRIAAATLANVALLVFLRYPISLWPIGLAQIVRRIVWMASNGRKFGIIHGLWMIPSHCLQRLKLRTPLPSKRIWEYLLEKRSGKPRKSKTS